ncbi:hypothetical protein O181_017633 [Austropuccinia psidii MF-1]|uniref:Uncharacterized protein n=1 Tax=Austropuccinia psidii MF-1 TaxID=1389203 RepID=A0A9Q3C6F3_9BASI|nr:hypothetical protein [Austropuccinia psidii MF-1]
MDTIIDGRTLRQIIPTMPFTFKFNGTLKPKDWKYMGQVLQLHQLLNNHFQCRMDKKRLSVPSHLEELGECCQKVCLKEIHFKDLMVITKGGSSNRQFKVLVERAARIRENQATIQPIEEQLNQKEHSLIPSGSQGVEQPKSLEASHHSGHSISGAKSQHSSQSQVLSRRIKGSKGKNKTYFKQRKKESDPMIQKLMDLVKEVHKSQE